MISLSPFSIFPFSNNQVRIVLYRECDLNGRRLLFDSSAIQKVHLEATPREDDKSSPNTNGKCQKNYIDVSNGYGYRYAKPETDYNAIGEMIFGSVAMSFRGTSLKVSEKTRAAYLILIILQPIHLVFCIRCIGCSGPTAYCAPKCSCRHPPQMGIVAAAPITPAVSSARSTHAR